MATAVRSSTEDRETFRKKFQSAMTVNSRKEMERLVRQNVDETVNWILEVAYGQVIAPSDGKLATFDALEKAWKDAKDTDFPAEMRRFYDRFDKEDFKTYNKLIETYNKLVADYFKALNKEGGPDTQEMVDFATSFDSLGEEFADFQCDYYASQCWAYSGVTWDEERAKDKADLKKACSAYGRMIEVRERIGLKDNILVQAKPRYITLVKQGHGPEGAVAPGGEGEEGAGPDQPAAEMVRVPLTFQLLEDIYAFTRPNYFVDEHYPLWHSFYLREVGSEITGVLRFEPLWKRSGHTIAARREGAAKIFIDVDGDQTRGPGDVDVPIKGNLAPVHVHLEVDGQPRDSAFWVQVGQEKDNYQGMEANLQGNDNQYGIYASPGGTMVGTIDGEAIRIIDEDMDGIYGGKPAPYAHVGMTKGYFHTEFDSMLIGSSKTAVPFSQFAKIGKAWYELHSVDDGTALEVAKVEPETGELKLKFKGPKPAFLVFQGKGSMEGALFDLTTSSSVEVPIGEYQLLAGMIAVGKKKQLQKVLIVAGESTPTWTVEAGKSVDVELGGPFGFDFKADVDPKGCQVIGETVVVVGAAGERYERPYLCVARPEASARVAGAKKGTKFVKMPATTDTMEVQKKGWNVTWFPKDLAIDVKGAEGEVEVQLTEKKHPLFGKITSQWLKFGS